MDQIIAISAGAVLGANARYWLGIWIDRMFVISFPMGTLLVNTSGSFLLGFFLVLTTERILVTPEWRLLVVVGFFGSYTTFSTFSVETWQLAADGSWPFALLNVLVSVGAGFLGAWLGAQLARVM